MTRQSSNTIQTLWVLIGSFSAFGFTIISSMLLSRYFDKQSYGTYKQVMYVYSTLLVVFTLGLPKAFSYFLPRVPVEQAKDLINKINIILLGLGLVMSLSLYLSSNYISYWLDNRDLAMALKYFSPVPLFMLPTMGIEGILSTFKQTKFLAFYSTLSKTFILLCVVLPVIFFNGGVNSAIMGFACSSFLTFLMASFFKYRPLKGIKHNKSTISFRNILSYTLPIMGASIWGIIISSSDQFFISRYFGAEVFADFANGSLELPFVGMIISATSTVLSPVFSKFIHEKGTESKDSVLDLWKSVFNKTIKLIYPLVCFIFVYASYVMIVLYGEKYASSGVFFQIKLIVNFFTVISYGPLLLAIGGQRFYFNVHMLGAIVLIILESLAVYMFKSAYIITAISVICQIGRIIAMLSFIANYFKISLLNLIPLKLILDLTIPSLAILFCLKIFITSFFYMKPLWVLMISFIVYCPVFFLWAKYRKIDYYSLIAPLFKKMKF